MSKYDILFEKVNKDNKEIMDIVNDIVNFNVTKEEDFLKLMEIREKYPNYHQSNLKTFDEWNTLGFRIKKGSVATKLYLNKDYKMSYFDIKQVYPAKETKEINNTDNNVAYYDQLNIEDRKELTEKRTTAISNELKTEVITVKEEEFLSNILNYMIIHKYKFIDTNTFNKYYNETFVFDELYKQYPEVFTNIDTFERMIKLSISMSKNIFNKLNNNEIYQKHLNNVNNSQNSQVNNTINTELSYRDIMMYCNKYISVMKYNLLLDFDEFNLFRENVKTLYDKQNIKNLSKACDEASNMMNLSQRKFDYYDKQENNKFDYEKIKNNFNNNYAKTIENIENLSKIELKETYINIYDKAPYSLRVVGIDENTKVRINCEAIKHIDKHFDKETKDNLIKQIPDMLANPVCILNGSKENSYIIVTEIKYNNDNIILPLSYDKNNENIDILIVDTLYEKWNTEFYLEKELTNHNVIAYNKLKMEQFRDPYDRLFLPKGDECSIYDNSIINSLDNVKYSSTSNYYTFETQDARFKPIFKANKEEIEAVLKEINYPEVNTYFNDDLTLKKDIVNKNELRITETDLLLLQEKLIDNRINQIEQVKTYYQSIGKYKELEKIESNSKNTSKAKTKQNTIVSTNNKIKDFGEKIGGAKKDLWKEKGISIANLAEMNEKEQAKYVVKSNIWIKPNYQELVDNGKEREVVYFYKTVIDAMPTTMLHKHGATLDEISQDNERFINCINKMKELVYNCNTLEDCINFKKVLIDNFLEGKTSWSFHNKDIYDNINLNKVFKAVSHWNYNPRYYISKMKESNFCASESDKIIQRFDTTDLSIYNFKENVDDTLRPYYIAKGNTKMFFSKERYESLKDCKFLGYDKSKREFIGANSLEELNQKYKDIVNEKDTIEKGRKQIFKYNSIDIKRTGGEEYLSGVATGDDYLNTFKFKGGEFGNWLNDKERQDNLNFAFNSFKDIATALGIRDEDISLNGKLSIAFGSRGSGRALAHYEPLRNVINLTKLKGAGSLAHEYGHFLDNNINELMKNLGTYASETCCSSWQWKGNDNIKIAYEQLMTTMKQKVANKEEQEQYRLKEMKNCKEASVMRYFAQYKDTKLYQKLESLFYKDSYNKNDYISVKNELKDRASDDQEKRAYDLFVRNEKYISIKLDNYYKLKVANFNGLKIDTDYLTMAKDFDKSYSKNGHGYWSSDCELFARSFDCYINDKLLEKGIVNTYLTGHCECAAPLGEERKAINKSFDNLFEEIKKTNLIYKNYIIDDMQVQKENKYIELIETLKNRYASPDNFIENMNTIKDTKGIDVAINKLQEKKALFDNSDAIINQVENYELKP